MDEKRIEEKIGKLTTTLGIQGRKQESVYDKFLGFRAAIVEAIALAWSDQELKEEYLRNPSEFMKKHLDYTFPFNMEMRVKDNPLNQWRPQQTGGWAGEHNTVELSFPNKPDEPEQQAIALAAYNRNYLTFFGSGRKISKK